MTHRFTLRQLEYLVAVADCGSVALAAGRVNVSSPSISAAIAQLEAGFGLQLFIRRHAQGLSLTEAGRQFTQTARAVLAEAARLTDHAAEIAGLVAGPLSVGCLVTFAQLVLPRLRQSFVARFHEVQFRQFELDQAGIFDALRLARIDVALTYDLDIPPDLEFQPLVTLPPYALLPLDHPLASRAEVTMQDLAPLPFILLDLPSSGAYFLSHFTGAGLAPRIAERTRDLGVMRAMVACGFGYSIANLRLGSDRAPDGQRLAQVPIGGAVRPIRLGLMLPPGTPRRTVQEFLHHAGAYVTEAHLTGGAA